MYMHVYIVVDQHHKIIEGAAAVSVAVYMKICKQLHGKTVAVVICGGNIKTSTLAQVINNNI